MDNNTDRGINNCPKLVNFAISCDHFSRAVTDMHLVVHISLFLSQGLISSTFLDLFAVA